MAIFGNSGFGLIYPATRSWGSTAGSGEFDIIPAFDKYTAVYDLNNTAFVKQESVINGHIEYVKKGDRHILKVDLHDLTSTQVANLLSANYKLVKYRLNTDNEDNEWIGWLIKVTPYYLKNIISLDSCSFEIESQEYQTLAVTD